MPTTRRRRTWLRPINAVLWLLFVGDLLVLLSVMLTLAGKGSFPIGHGTVRDFFQGTSYAHRSHPELMPEDVILFPSDRPDVLQRLLYVIGHGLATCLATFPMIVSGQGIIEEARTGDPFTQGMVRRLRRLGALVLVGGLLAEVAGGVASSALLAVSLPDDAQLRFDSSTGWQPSFWWVIVGLILLALSEVLQRGCDLRADLDGLV